MSSRTRPSKVECVLIKLNAHGICFAIKLKRLISEFAGVPVGESLRALNAAFRNLT
jgi:hypothetical protein